MFRCLSSALRLQSAAPRVTALPPTFACSPRARHRERSLTRGSKTPLTHLCNQQVFNEHHGDPSSPALSRDPLHPPRAPEGTQLDVVSAASAEASATTSGGAIGAAPQQLPVTRVLPPGSGLCQGSDRPTAPPVWLWFGGLEMGRSHPSSQRPDPKIHPRQDPVPDCARQRPAIP